MEKLLKDRRVLIGIVIAIIVIVGGLMAYNSHLNNLEGDWVVVSQDGDENDYDLAVFKIKDGKFKTNVDYASGIQGKYNEKEAETGTFAYDKKNGTVTVGVNTGTYILSDDKQTVTMHLGDNHPDDNDMFDDQTVVMARKGSSEYKRILAEVKKNNDDY